MWGNRRMPNSQQPLHVRPGFKFVFLPEQDTVETHMLQRNADGSVAWEITHATSSSTFMQGEAEYVTTCDEIRAHRARSNVVSFPDRESIVAELPPSAAHAADTA